MKRKIFSVILWLTACLTYHVYAQEESMRSAPAAAEQEVSALHEQYLDSANLVKQSNLGKSLDYIAESMSLITAAGNQELWAESLVALGEVYLFHQQPDLAISKLKEALDLVDSADTALLLGRAYLVNKEYANALAVFNKILEGDFQVPYKKIEALEGQGDALTGSGRFDEAITSYQEGLKIANDNDIAPKITDLNSKIAGAYDADDQTGAASEYYENSLKSASDLPVKKAVREREKVADFYQRNNRIDDEIALRKESLDQLEQIAVAEADVVEESSPKDSVSTQQINYKIANAYAAKDEYDEAINYLQQSLEQAQEDQDLEVQKEATRALSEAYKNKGDFSNALTSYQQYVTLVDTLYAQKERQISAASKMNMEIVNQQNRIQGLERERELSQSKYNLAITEQQLFKERNQRQTLIIYSLVFGLFLMALLAYFFYRSTRQQKLANNLLALKSLRTQMNPHFIFNALNSVNNFIAKNDERMANAYLSDFSGLMRSVLEHSESDFIPLAKEINLLSSYLKLEHSRFSDKFTYSLIVAEDLNVDAFRIPPMLVQPYIENAIWHGLRYKEKEGELSIKFKQPNAKLLKITITDNGIGRRRSQELKTGNQVKKESKAMANIEKRIEILNEMYPEIISVEVSDLKKDGSGTCVVLTIQKDSSQ